jgi:hypothetical protein
MFKFNPEDGLRNTSSFADEPANPRDDVQDLLDQIPAYINKYLNTVNDTGTANNIVVTFDPAPESYEDGFECIVKVKNSNTGACAIKVNTLAAIPIKKNYNEDLVAGDMLAGQEIHLKYDGTNFQLMNSATSTINNNISQITTNVAQAKGFNLDLARCYSQNVVQIATCEADEGWANNEWAGRIGTYSADTVNFRTGLAGAKMTVASGVFDGGIHLVKSLDLSKFSDGSLSSINDYICFVLYIDATSLANQPNNKVLTLVLPCDSLGALTNYLYFDIPKASLTAGYNYIKLKKSDILITGNASWATIKGISIFVYATPSGTVNITVDNIQLVRKDPVDTKPNPFQHKENGAWVRDFTINSGEWFVGKEFGKLVCKELKLINNYQGTEALISSQTFSDFVINYLCKIVKTGGTSDTGVGFRIDASNWINAIFYSDAIHVRTNIAGTIVNTIVPFTVAIGDIVNLTMIRRGTSINIICSKNNDTANAASYTTEFSPTGVGSLVIVPQVSLTPALNAVITTTLEACHANEADVAKSICQPYCRVYRNAAQAIANNGSMISFDTETEDNWSMHDNSINPDRITISQNGVYVINAQAAWGEAVTGLVGIAICRNGAETDIGNYKSDGVGNLTRQQCYAILRLAANDYITIKAYQATGASKALQVGSSSLNYCEVVKISD